MWRSKIGFFQVLYQNIWDTLGLKMCLSDVGTEEPGQHEVEVSAVTLSSDSCSIQAGFCSPVAPLAGL